MTQKTSYVPSGMEWMENRFGMSPAIRSGDLVWLSGVTVSPVEGEHLETALERMFATTQAILKEANLTWSDVIDVTSFHVDLESQKEAFLKVKSRYITTKPFPSWSAIEVKALWAPTIVAEIKVVARAV